MGKNPPIETEDGLPPGIQEVDGYRFDFNGWTLGDLLDYNQGVSNGELLGLITVLSKTITAWPLETPPNQVESFRGIALTFWKKEVLPRMFRAVAKEFSKSDSPGDDSDS